METSENKTEGGIGERWYHLKSQEVLMKLSSGLSGLLARDIAARQSQYGRNAFDHKKTRGTLGLFLGQFKDALAIILLVAAGLSFAFGEMRDATIILVIVLANALISFIQEYKAEKILDHMERLVTARAIVIRDGEKKEIDATELVPGDVIAMNAGARVPADAYILESYSCKVDGFIFSGESKPEKREAKVMKDEIIPMSDIENMLFMGESVVAGEALAVVVAIGAQTQLGRLAELATDAESDVTPLQKKMKKLGRNVTMLAVAIGAITVFLGQYFGLSWYENFLLALALAVSIVPEGLPAAISVALALGMKRLLKRNVLAKRLSAVETLGSVTVICTDKTGTITRNELMVTRIVTGKTVYEVSGEGYSPTGNFFAAGEVVNARTIPNAELLFRIGTLCNDASLVQDDTSRYVIAGDPTEGAILVAARKFNSDPNFFMTGEHKIAELPFASERMRMSVAYRNAHKQSLVKGSPDVLLELATHRLDESGEAVLFSETEKQETRKLYDKFSREALRVLAFAYRDLEGIAETHYSEEMEHQLVWVGMMAMIDPPRADVAQAVKECHSLGLRVVMITGDYAITAEAIAKQSCLIDDAHPYTVISGRDLLTLSDDEVYKEFKHKEVVFARFAPEQKLRLATLLQERGEVVAMTGDGVNDAPALKRADIGVAMGIMGTDVSKEAADMILLDDNFASIVHGVKEGRMVYSNLRKFTHYVFTSNVSELLTVLLGLLLQIPAPLLAVQILAIDLGTDVLPSFALGLEPEDKEAPQQQSVQQGRQIISFAGVKHLLILGTIMAAGAIMTFTFSLWRHGFRFGETIASDNPIYLQAATAAYIVLAITQMANLLQSRSEHLSFFRMGMFRNMYVWGAIVCSFVLIWLFTNISFFKNSLHMMPIEATDWALVAFFTGVVFVYEEWRKKRITVIA
ncbi:MAG: cation-transporting P-type ATPase [Candidatus Moranbacteria bacterium]|nr:cation-transporting P-type ATPase [Candidatus Moranbacteria bacterium]